MEDKELLKLIENDLKEILVNVSREFNKISTNNLEDSNGLIYPRNTNTEQELYLIISRFVEEKIKERKEKGINYFYSFLYPIRELGQASDFCFLIKKNEEFKPILLFEVKGGDNAIENDISKIFNSSIQNGYIYKCTTENTFLDRYRNEIEAALEAIRSQGNDRDKTIITFTILFNAPIQKEDNSFELRLFNYTKKFEFSKYFKDKDNYFDSIFKNITPKGEWEQDPV